LLNSPLVPTDVSPGIRVHVPPPPPILFFLFLQAARRFVNDALRFQYFREVVLFAEQPAGEANFVLE
jgi:hypothetical protein